MFPVKTQGVIMGNPAGSETLRTDYRTGNCCSRCGKEKNKFVPAEKCSLTAEIPVKNARQLRVLVQHNRFFPTGKRGFQRIQ